MASLFPFPIDWSNPPSVRFDKPIDFFSATNKQEQSIQVAGPDDFIVTIDASYTVFSATMLRALEAALGDTADGLHLIPFYPEPLTAALDMQGSVIWAGNSPDYEAAVFSPESTGGLSPEVIGTVPVTIFGLTADWYLTRLDREDWNNSETIQVTAWALLGGVLSYLMASPFVKTIPLENQTFFWTAPMAQKGPAKVTPVTDSTFSVAVSWER